MGEFIEGITFKDRMAYPNNIKDVKAYFQGEKYNIPLTEEALSKHILFSGAIGSGKTTALNGLLSSLIATMTSKDVMIIFDSKGDFRKKFYRPGRDEILSSDKYATVIWNLFRELELDGKERVPFNLIELLNSIFNERIKRSNAPFFPMAAKDVLYGIISYIKRVLEPCDCHNKELYLFLRDAGIEKVADSLESMDDLRGTVDYLRVGEFITEQTQGVYSELRNVVNEYLIGNFREKGDFSVREFVRKKGARILFVEYDISIGSVLTPIYKTILDLAIKETLSREKSDGNVYFVIDEFSLLPNLYHIADGVNFGRSLGAKFIVAIQNVMQILESYGRENGYSILSAFGTYAAFRSSDIATIKFIQERYGTVNRTVSIKGEYSDSLAHSQLITGKAVNDWDILNLGVGEAILSVSSYAPNPVKYKFKNIV